VKVVAAQEAGNGTLKDPCSFSWVYIPMFCKRVSPLINTEQNSLTVKVFETRNELKLSK
jgi:hypothetical protein